LATREVKDPKITLILIEQITHNSILRKLIGKIATKQLENSRTRIETWSLA
jgi:hypothetical protein